MKFIILAIILAESGFNPKAYNKQGNASGLMQLTPIGLKEASIQCNMDRNPDLFKPEINIKYGECLYNYYRSISVSDVEALILYHGGFKARERFRQGKSPGKKTSLYVNRVLDYKERFKNEKINVKYYCNKYPSLPNSICQKKGHSDRRE